MKIPKKYLHKSGCHKGKLKQKLVETGLKNLKRGDEHPNIPTLYFIYYRSKSGWKGCSREVWGTASEVENERNRAGKCNKKWRITNPERSRDIWKKSTQKRRDNGKLKKYLEEPNNYCKKILSDRVRTAVSNQFTQKAYKTITLLGCTVEQARKHLESQFKLGMSWYNYGEWQIDHIIPCAFFDLTKPSHQKVCFNYQNLQPLWRIENRSKSDKIHWSIVLTLMMNNYKTIGLN
jgi:hypothetical protein